MLYGVALYHLVSQHWKIPADRLKIYMRDELVDPNASYYALVIQSHKLQCIVSSISLTKSARSWPD